MQTGILSVTLPITVLWAGCRLICGLRFLISRLVSGGPVYEEVFSIIKKRPEMGFSQTTSLFGKSLVAKALSNKYVFLYVLMFNKDSERDCKIERY